MRFMSSYIKKKASLSLQFFLLFGNVVSVDFTATKRSIKVS